MPKLKSISKECHISKFCKKKVAIDAYVWLHQGAVGFAKEICLNLESKSRFVGYCEHMVKMLLYYEVIPVVVFDGTTLPSKKVTEASRAQQRQNSLDRACAFYASGNFKEAENYFKKALNITPALAFEV